MNSQHKSFPLAASTIALVAGAIALSASITSMMPALAQANNSAPSSQRDQRRPANFLNLTAEQQSRMEQIRQNERSQIDAILTADQQAQLQRERANRKPPSGDNRGTSPTGTPPTGERQGRPSSPFVNLNLTAEQRSRIEAIRNSTKEQMDAILTPEQRQQLQQFQQQQPRRPQAQTR